MKPTIKFGVLAVLVLVFLAGCQPVPAATTLLNNQNNYKSQIMPSNYIYCNIDGVQKDFSLPADAKYNVNYDFTVIAGKLGTEFINISYPGNIAGEFINEFSNKSKTHVSTPNIIYGIYGTKSVQTFESNYFEQGSVNIKVLKSDETHTEGTFSGIVTEYTEKGFLKNKKSLSDCKFSVKKLQLSNK